MSKRTNRNHLERLNTYCLLSIFQFLPLSEICAVCRAYPRVRRRGILALVRQRLIECDWVDRYLMSLIYPRTPSLSRIYALDAAFYFTHSVPSLTASEAEFLILHLPRILNCQLSRRKNVCTLHVVWEILQARFVKSASLAFCERSLFKTCYRLLEFLRNGYYAEVLADRIHVRYVKPDECDLSELSALAWRLEEVETLLVVVMCENKRRIESTLAYLRLFYEKARPLLDSTQASWRLWLVQKEFDYLQTWTAIVAWLGQRLLRLLPFGEAQKP